MRISHRYRFVMLSRRKCASSTMRIALNAVSDIRSTQEYPYYHHTPLVPLKQHFAEQGWDWSSYFVFTTMRNPYAVVESLYTFGHPDVDGTMYWDRLWDEIVAKGGIAKERRVAANPAPFRDWLMSHDFAEYALDPFVRDESGAVAVDRILRVENLDEEFAEVARVLQLEPVPKLVPQNVSDPYERHRFDDEMADRVRHFFATDFEIGGYDREPPHELRASATAKSSGR